MTPVESFRLLSLRGCTIFSMAGGGLEVEGPDSVVDEILPFVRENKAGLIALLADPRKEAYRNWEAALGDVAARWGAHARAASAAGQEPRWLDDELLTDAVREAILAAHDAAGLTRALEAVEAWRAAWSQLIARQIKVLSPAEKEASSGGGPVRASRGPDWRSYAPDGQPWPETAYWRCPGCERTFKPREFVPNPKRLCRECLRAEDL